jgi:hypothetical protein
MRDRLLPISACTFTIMPSNSNPTKKAPSFDGDQAWSCEQRSAKWLGGVSFGLFGFAAVMCILSKDPTGAVGPLLVFAFFSAVSAYLYLYSGTISMDRRGITKVCPLGTYFIDWRSITDIWTGNGQLVFAGSDLRLAMPDFDWWTGHDKAQMLSLLGTFCSDNEIRPKERLSASVMISRGTRQSSQANQYGRAE